MRRLLDGALDKAAQMDARLLACLVIVPATLVYWAALTMVLNLGMMPVTITGCLLLALSLVLLDRGISLFFQWTAGADNSADQFIPV